MRHNRAIVTCSLHAGRTGRAPMIDSVSMHAGRAGDEHNGSGTLFLMAPLEVPRDGVGAVTEGCSVIFGRDSREVFVRASRIVAIPVTDIFRP